MRNDPRRCTFIDRPSVLLIRNRRLSRCIPALLTRTGWFAQFDGDRSTPAAPDRRPLTSAPTAMALALGDDLGNDLVQDCSSRSSTATRVRRVLAGSLSPRRCRGRPRSLWRSLLHGVSPSSVTTSSCLAVRPGSRRCRRSSVIVGCELRVQQFERPPGGLPVSGST